MLVRQAVRIDIYVGRTELERGRRFAAAMTQEGDSAYDLMIIYFVRKIEKRRLAIKLSQPRENTDTHNKVVF
jgi:hypothetical protein